ncbi:ParB N-terminal domain-containing protein [Tumebacillus sp. ITR2]|uniref:ParB N-terminal domain-containing protein n=1 Tax=Tumebacillus amylolyticus TaxID=2801339 RepID=A0ABS1JCA6_9BACL|nr:ParB N-terminal domain-containing protein [Tumebacillus amylolyticus]MBL0387906.1 ParB N-terminal domain-containing protein [Tumebacillus amylolyticus]
MNIRTVPVTDINPSPYNPRIDLQPGDAEFEKLRRSIEEFGYVDPLIWNQRTGNLVGGHQRFKVLLAAGATELDVSVVDLDDVQERQLNLALNKISGDWDENKLSELLHELEVAGADLDLTGFDDKELDGLLKDFRPEDDETVGDFESAEINLGSFSDENFEAECPRCGFCFNPKEPEAATAAEEGNEDA